MLGAARGRDPMKPYQIKEFVDCRIDELHALFRDVYASSNMMSETLAEKYPDIASFARDLATLRQLPGAIAMAVVIAHRPVAYVIIRPRRPSRLQHTADLNMGVARRERGQGLGRLILQVGLDRARVEPRLEIVYLMVRADNTPAIGLYEQAGFTPLCVLHRDIRINETYFDGVLMRLCVVPGMVSSSPMDPVARATSGPA